MFATTFAGRYNLSISRRPTKISNQGWFAPLFMVQFFDLNASQFQWMISGRSYSFRSGIFGNILQFIFLPIVKSCSLLWVDLWLLQSLWVTCMPYFSTFLQNLLHYFLHTPCQNYWHTINDYKKVVIYGLFWFLIFICQRTTINPWFVLV
jgi:hypothetical protein